MSRVGSYLRTLALQRRATETEAAIAGVVGELLEDGGEHEISTTQIRRECAKRGVLSPWSGAPVSHGTIASALSVVARAGALLWARAYVFRYHHDQAHDPSRPRVIPQADGGYRLPTRVLRLSALALTLAIAPVGASEARLTGSDLVSAGGESEPPTPQICVPQPVERAPEALATADDFRRAREKLRWG